MSSLLELAIEAHGGLKRWNEVQRFEAQLSITGAIWDLKQVPDIFKSVTMRALIQTPEVALLPVGGDGNRTFVAADELVWESDSGEVLERRIHPERSFSGQTLESAWDKLHAAHFASEAIWTYLTVPFLFTYPGFTSREIEPRHEAGQTWRGLEVTFPDTVHSHTRVQKFYFGEDFLLRRHDYTVDILAGGTGANYATDIANIDGIKVPMKRRTWAYDKNEEVIPDPLLVAVDILNLRYLP
jgi:hypothetical protein